MKSYWIWHYGDYEIFHHLAVHTRREEHGKTVPAFWHIDTPHVNVVFIKEFECDSEKYLIASASGNGCLSVDGIKYRFDERITVAPGKHTVKIEIFKQGGLPSVFVESDVCPSGGDWLSSPQTGIYTAVGFNEYFDCVDKDPEVFPFSYERKYPVKCCDRCGGILYDFGEELFGYLNISGADKNDTLQIYYGESEEEATGCEDAMLFEYVSGSEDHRLIQRAFRYIFIRTDGVTDLSVCADHEYLSLEKRGDFTCDNDLFNKIYDSSVRTFHLNCREGFFDGIKRDRWIWSGDAYQSARINAYLFADRDIVQRTALGLVGKMPIVQHINTIVDYSLLWIIGLEDYLMTYGADEFLRRIHPMLLKMADFCKTRLDDNGFIVGKDADWTFIDWSDIDRTGPVCAEQMLLIAAYRAIAHIEHSLGIYTDDFAGAADRLVSKVNEYFWDEERKAFIDSYESGKRNVTRHGNIFAVMYGIATTDQTRDIVENVLKNDSVPKITTPYFEGYELDVLCKTCEFEAVEDMLTSYWGGMISLGATTVWEEFHPNMIGAEHYAMYGDRFAKSLCHAWGAGPIYLFGRYYLGVYPTSEGYTSFNVEPNLGGLSCISGTVPINGGEVTVKLDGERLTLFTDKPGGTLIWDGKKYPIVPGEWLTIEM